MSTHPAPSPRSLTVHLVTLAVVWLVSMALPGSSWATSISGRSWWDDDGDGLQGGLESDLPYVEVRLLDFPGLALQTTTFTDASGFYLFPELTPGDYVLEFVAPTAEMWSPQDVGGDDAIDSDVDPTDGRTSPITLMSGVEADADAGIAGRGEIAGLAWFDEDGDGIQGGLEPALADVLVRLYDANTLTLQRAAYTDASGFWSFQRLLPGDYYVEYVAPTDELLSSKDVGFDDSVDSDVDPITGQSDPFALVSQGFEQIDAGVAGRAGVGGFAWFDEDGDGIQDGIEPALGDIEVRLYDGNTLTLLRVTHTDAAGFWEFAFVLPGDYNVEYVAPTGELLSPKDAGFDDLVDSDVDPITGQSDPFTLVPQSYETIDAGVAGRAGVGGYAWFDEDGDGIQDGIEDSLADVEVRLYDANTLTQLRVTHTDAAGFWEFAFVLPGDYYVEYVAPTGELLSPKDAGFDDLVDSDVDPITGQSDPFTLVPQSFETIDAGVAGRAGVGGYAWLDEDGDGIQDGGETSLENVEVRLYDANTLTLLRVTHTDAGGFWEFAFVLPGDYCVEYVAPTGDVFSPKDVGGDDGIDSDVDPVTGQSDPFVLLPQFFEYLDAGIEGKGAAFGLVWQDDNADGIQDFGEPSLADIEVRLLDAGTLAVLAITYTDGGGIYDFAELAPDTYVVEVVAPAGETFSPKDVGGDDGIDSDVDPVTGRTDPFVVLPQSGPQHDAGLSGPGTPTGGDVVGCVWDDVDGNGIQDGGEPGIVNVSVRLLDSGTLATVASTITNAAGGYRLPYQPAGNYLVEITAPTGEQFTVQDVGADDTIDSDVDDATGRGPVFALGLGGLVDFDAGILGRGEVVGTVWEDVDADGVRGGGEPIYEYPVEVRLLDSLLTPVDTVWTTFGGSYRFPDVEVGNYVVEFVLPAEEDFSPQDVGADDSIDSDADPGTGQTALFPVDADTVQDFDVGFGGRGEVVGTVWEDVDADGVRGGGEPIYEYPVEVRLLDSLLTPVETVWTTFGGNYRFPRVEIGNYVVEFVLPVEEEFSPQDVGADDSIDSDADPGSGQTALFPVDADTVQDFDVGFVGRGEVVGTVWEDVDADGVRGGGEPIYEVPVEVRLLDSLLTPVEAVWTTFGGSYRFPQVEIGNYVVEFVLPVEEEFSPQDVGADDSIDSDADPGSGQTALFPVDADTVQDFDVGFVGRGEVVGTLWEDEDGDGLRAGEPIFEDAVEVRLLDSLLTPVETVWTTFDGSYRFPQVEIGNYVVEIVVPADEIFSPQDVGADDTVDSDTDPGSGQTALFPLDADTVQDFDAGFIGRGQVTGRAWQDDDGDGVQDAGESSLGTVVVRLLDFALNPIYESFTGLGGVYLFPELDPGAYVVEFDARAGEIFSPQDVGADSDDSDVDAGGQVGPFLVDSDVVEDRDAGLIASTWAPLASIRVLTDGPRTVVEWRTAAEVGTAGFELYRVEEDGREFRVHEGLVPALFGDVGGGVYRVVDDSARLRGALTYRLVEVEADGGRGSHGPFSLEPEVDSAPSSKNADDAGFARTVQPETARSREDASARVALAAAAEKAKPTGSGGGSGGGPADALTIRVEGRGLVHLDAASLADAFGLPEQVIEQRIRGGRLALHHSKSADAAADEVAWLADADDSGLSFYAAGLGHPERLYSRHDAYRLELDWGVTMDTADGGAPAPASADASFAVRERYEENVFAVTSLPLEADEDPWFWHYVLAGNPVHGARTFSLTVDEVSTGLGEASLTVRLHGAGQAERADDHRAVIRLNGWELGSLRWGGLESATATFDIDPVLLVNGVNEVEVRGELDPGVDYSLFVIDHFELVYPRTYRVEQPSLHFKAGNHDVVTLRGLDSPNAVILDVSDPLRPQWVENVAAGQDAEGWHLSFFASSPDARYVARFEATGPGGGLTAEIRPAVGDRLRSAGNRADYLVIAPADFANAARELADLREAQGLSALVVTLDEIVDEFHHGVFHPRAIREFLAYAHAEWSLPPRYVVLAGNGTFDYLDHMGLGDNALPPLLVSSAQGLHPSDSRLADLEDPEGFFDGPEMVIGRIPANTPEELGDYVQKVASFESGAPVGRVLMSADNPDRGGDFPADSDALAGWLRPGSGDTVYLSELSVPDARDALFLALDEGVDHVNYVGHGALRNLAAEGLLTTSDVGGLENLRQPVVTALTCTSNFFASPGVDSLGEALILRQGGGAVAVWAPSWLSANGQANDLASTFFGEYYGGSEGRLGDAILHALRQAAANGMPPGQLGGFVLLGDPALLRPEGGL